MGWQEKRVNLRVLPDCRDRLKSLKRGGESYDDLLRKMADQYDPEAALESDGG